MLVRPNGPALILYVDDPTLAAQILIRRGFNLLGGKRSAEEGLLRRIAVRCPRGAASSVLPSAWVVAETGLILAWGEPMR